MYVVGLMWANLLSMQDAPPPYKHPLMQDGSPPYKHPLIMYILTTLEFPKHNFDYHLLTTSVNAKYYC